MNKGYKESSSFRDPSGFLFWENGKLLRQINSGYKEDYDHLVRSGLYEKLVTKELLIPHKELAEHTGISEGCYKVIEPQLIDFISYAYEWSFNQLKDAALVTLRIQNLALKHGMILKDASAYNIQFYKGKPILIDTLSFEKYQENSPWIAYRQFVQHFLAPLALMSYCDIRLNSMLKNHLDGIPLEMASRLLPWHTKLNLGLILHIHTHSLAQKKYQASSAALVKPELSRKRMEALIKSLWQLIHKLKVREKDSEWMDYYTFTNYTPSSFDQKKTIIHGVIQDIKPSFVWDIGANTGEFTQLVSRLGIPCIAFDIDHLAVDRHYVQLKKHNLTNTLPLVLDITNPSPAIGWANNERMNLEMRKKPDLIMALALIHHLAISNNIPFEQIASYLGRLSDKLIIEFVPKEDSQVQLLLTSRKDVFPDYSKDSFLRCFKEVFHKIDALEIDDSTRTIFFMQK